MNPNPPFPTPAREISVITPINEALERVKLVLFRPFDIGKWFVIGFSAWLAYLGEQGGGSFNFNFGSGRDRSGGNLPRQLEQAKDYVMDNLHWIVPVAVVVTLLGLALWVLFLWLSSRGKFMFLHCVALNVAEVQSPWRRYAREANSLWLFRLVLALVSMLFTLPLAGVIGFLVYGMVRRGEPDAAGIAIAAGAFLMLLGLGLVWFIINKLTKDFVVPIMYLRGKKCMDGWREFRALMAGNVAELIVYLLFQVVMAMAIATLVVIVVLVTCCIAGCLMAIPYLGTVVLLPVLMFHRSYTLYYLAQFGPQYNVFPPPAPAPVAAMPPPTG